MILEVPHFASLRSGQREITVLRSDNGQTWREHPEVATEQSVQNVLRASFEGMSKSRFLSFGSVPAFAHHISSPSVAPAMNANVT